MTLSTVLSSQTNTSRSDNNLASLNICLVTCNDSGTLNKISWNSKNIPGNGTITIYRSLDNVTYFEIGKRSWEDSLYIDTDTIKKGPRNTSFYYQIQYIDQKGNSSKKSIAHRSIFIEGNLKGTFSWNAYEVAQPNANGKVFYTLWRKDVDRDAPTEVGTTANTILPDPEFKQHEGKGSLWWVTLDEYTCGARKTRPKSNNSNE